MNDLIKKITGQPNKKKTARKALPQHASRKRVTQEAAAAAAAAKEK